LISSCLLATGALVAYYAYDRMRLPIDRPVTSQKVKQIDKSPETEVNNTTSAAEPSDPPWADPKPKDVQRLPE
jgi:hypothetical protein